VPTFVAAKPAPVLDLGDIGPPEQACVDFFEYVNGQWAARTPIPPDQSSVDISTDMHRAKSRKLLGALERARSSPAMLDTPGKRLAVAYYASGMDLATIEQAGLKALASWSAQIDALSDAKQLPALIGKLNRIGVSAPLSLYVDPDPADRRREIVQVYQGGLGLSDRDEYFKNDERAREVQAAYRTYRERLWTLYGVPAAAVERLSPQVYALETRLARASMTLVQQRDPKAVYNPATLSDLPKLATFEWPSFLRRPVSSRRPASSICRSPISPKWSGRRCATPRSTSGARTCCCVCWTRRRPICRAPMPMPASITTKKRWKARSGGNLVPKR
jgi:putative endopeptidase